jgi:hypothetical protein
MAVRHGHGILARTADCCLILIDHRVDCLHPIVDVAGIDVDRPGGG